MQPLLARNVDIRKPKPCRPMPASGFMNAKAAALYSNQQKVTVVSFVLMARYRARLFSKKKFLLLIRVSKTQINFNILGIIT